MIELVTVYALIYMWDVLLFSHVIVCMLFANSRVMHERDKTLPKVSADRVILSIALVYLVYLPSKNFGPDAFGPVLFAHVMQIVNISTLAVENWSLKNARTS